MISNAELHRLSDSRLLKELERRNGCRVIVVSRVQYTSTLKALNTLADDQMKAYRRTADCMVNLDKGVQAS